MVYTSSHGFLRNWGFVATIEYVPPSPVLQAGLLPTGTFEVSFLPDNSKLVRTKAGLSLPNLPQEIAPFLSPRLIEGNSEQTRQAMQEFVVGFLSFG